MYPSLAHFSLTQKHPSTQQTGIPVFVNTIKFRSCLPACTSLFRDLEFAANLELNDVYSHVHAHTHLPFTDPLYSSYISAC